MGYKWEILRSAVEQKILFPSVDVYKEYLSQLDNKGVPYEIVLEKNSPTGKIVVIMRKPYNNNAFLEREDMTPDPCFDVPIHKTTHYFKISKEEAAAFVNGVDTVEEAKVLDAGVEHYFYETYEELVGLLQDTEFQEYVKEKNYEKLVFEFVCDNLNNNKYCVVLK